MKDRIKGRKSYLYKFFLNFLLVLLIPFLTICILYNEVESTVKNQILLSNANVLDQYFRTLDMVVGEMKSICISIAGSKECIDYQVSAKLNSKRTGYQAYVVKEVLNDYPGERYCDIFVYFPENEKIISGVKSYLNVEFYYDTYYGGVDNPVRDEAMYQKFVDMLNCDSGTPTLYAISGEGNTVYLCMAMKYEDYQMKKSHVVAVVLHPEVVNQLIGSNIKKLGNVVMIFDKDNKMIISNSEEISEWRLDEHYDSIEPYEKMHEGQTYLIHMKKSEKVKAYYASAIPYEYFWQKLFHLRVICGTGILLCILCSLWVAYKCTKRVYRPVNDVLALLREKMKMTFDVSKKTEFEYITDSIVENNEKINMLNHELKYGNQVKRDRFLQDVFEGKCSQNEIEDNGFEKYGITLCSERFCVCVMERSVQTDVDTEMALFIVKNVYEELLEEGSIGYVVRISPDRYAILINLCQGVDERKTSEIMKVGSDFLQKNFKMTLTIGISSIREGIMEIGTAYQEALNALQYSYLLGKGMVIEFGHVNGRGCNNMSTEDPGFKVFNMILDYIKMKSEDISPAQFVTEMLNYFGINAESSLEMVEGFKYEIFGSLNRILTKNRFDVENKDSVLKNLLFQPTLHEFKESLIHLVGVLKNNELNRQRQEGVCDRTKKYIDENYMDSGLSLDVLGKKMDISGWYLSKLFKEKWGISISDYISKVRIQNSKLLLKETQKSVQDIAVEMGFLSSNVFIRSFKKWEGITPGVYRGLDLES